MFFRSDSRCCWPALLLPLGVWAAEAPSTQMCGNEHLPRLDPSRAIVCALDQGIARDTDADQGDNLRAALSRLPPGATGLFLPQGRYLVGGVIDLGSGQALVGSRQGTTHLINPGSAYHSLNAHGDGVLIEGLVLDNRAVELYGNGNDKREGKGEGHVLRYTGFREMEVSRWQLSVHGSVPHKIIGNVLWPSASSEGGGIRMTDVRQGMVEGNLVGSTDAAGLSAKTRDLNARMATLPRRDGSMPPAAPALNRSPASAVYGHRMKSTLFRGNRFGATVTLSATEHLTVQGNHFVPATPTWEVDLELRGTLDSWVTGNTFERMPLSVDLGEHHGVVNTWGPHIVGNWFLDTLVQVEQTDGLDGPLKAPTDLVLIGNRFSNPPMPCAIEAVEWSVPERRFLVADNGALSDGAWACHARNIGLDEARDRLSRRGGDMTAPAVPFGLVGWQAGREIFELKSAEGAAPIPHPR